MGRLGEASEVATVIKFLASPDASYLTGEVIQINGGQALSKEGNLVYTMTRSYPHSGPWHYPAYPGPGWIHDGSGGVL